MNNTTHFTHKLTHGLWKIERKLLDMVLLGMGDPEIELQLWDGTAVLHHPRSNIPVVYIESRTAFWRFLFNPRVALFPDAVIRGLIVSDDIDFEQALQQAGNRLPAETVMVRRLLRIKD
jgi:hypothetical protein